MADLFVEVDADGVAAGWADGVFSGDPRIICEAAGAASEARPVVVFGARLICGDDFPAGVLASLCAWAPGRTRITAATAGSLDGLLGCLHDDDDDRP